MSTYFGTTQDDLINTIFVTGGVTGPMDPATGKVIPPGDANDSIITFDGDDIVQTGGGNDQVDLGNGDDTFVLNVGDDDDFIHDPSRSAKEPAPKPYTEALEGRR